MSLSDIVEIYWLRGLFYMTKNYSLWNYFLSWLTVKNEVAALQKLMAHHPDRSCIWSMRCLCEQTVAHEVRVLLEHQIPPYDIFLFFWQFYQSTSLNLYQEIVFHNGYLNDCLSWVVGSKLLSVYSLCCTTPYFLCFITYKT